MTLQVDHLILEALKEDISSEDVTTNSVMKEAVPGEVDLICKEDGIIAGLEIFSRVFTLLDADTKVELFCKDGDEVKKGQKMGKVTGDIRVLLSGERVALNYLQRMSGIATYTHSVASLLEGTGITLLDTRKTTPNMRIFEKYAVRVGGGQNHRYNLSDGVLLKDNHIGAAGSVAKAVKMAQEYAPFVRKIEVEADFQVWKEYAYANGLHPAVISYLNTKKQNFYQMETTVDGRCFATPRGWEDLSTMIGIYEKIDKTIDREVVAQYIQHPKIAKDFANYLELFYKYRTDYQIEEIFKGNPDEILMKKVSHASFDERLAVLGLLISKVNERIRFAVEKEEEMELLQGTLIRYKESGQAEVSKDALELLEEVTAGLLFEEKQKKEAELLSRRQEQNYRRAGTLLETYLQRLRLEGSMDFETAFAKIKEWFEEENQKYLQMGQTAEQYLEYAFDFLEGTGLTGQEMVIFITELNSNARSVAFLQECESERYFRYNKELLFSEKREKILEKLN